GRVLVELKIGVLESILSITLLAGGCRCRLLPGREEPHHCVSVMPCRRVMQKLAWLIADCAEHDSPRQQFGVAHLVQLFNTQVEKGIRVAPLQFSDHPPVEVKLRMQILPGAREMRHAAARNDGYPFGPRSYDTGDLTPEHCASFRSRQWGQVDVGMEGNYRNIATSQHEFEGDGERMSEDARLQIHKTQ